LKRNDVLDFNLNNSDLLREVKYSGISLIQRDGAWNNETEASISIHLKRDNKPHLFKLTAEAFVIPGLIDKQHVVIYAEETKTDNKLCEKVFTVPDESIENDSLKIRMEFPDAVSPLFLGIGRDDRKRAIFLRSITLM